MARKRTTSAPMHGTTYYNGNSAAVGLAPQSQEILGKVLEELYKLKEQHDQQVRALFELRAQVVAAEDVYLEQEAILNELFTLLSNEDDTTQMHAGPNKKKKRHTAGSTSVTPDLEREVNDATENATGMYGQKDSDDSEEETIHQIPENPGNTVSESDGGSGGPVGDGVDESNANTHGHGVYNTPARKETWESYTSDVGNANAPQQPAPVRKQTARRSQPHFGRTKSLSSRNHKPDVSPTSTADLSKFPSSPVYSEASIPTQNSPKDEEVKPMSSRRMELSELHVLEQAINSLPPPPRMDIPNEPRSFSNALVTSSLGGNRHTFAKVGPSMLEHQVFKCPEMIKVNPETHGHAPLTGQHGALTMVDGQDGNGELGKIYPLFRKNKRGWEYAGEYEVARRVEVPVAVWKKWPDHARQAIAHRIDTSVTGQNVLLRRGIASDDYTLGQITEEDILGFFEKPDEPNLRMSWALLQCVGYAREKHDILAQKQDEELGSRPTSGTLLDRDSPTHVKSKKVVQSHRNPTRDSAIRGTKKRRERQSTVASSDSEDHVRGSKRLRRDDGISNKGASSPATMQRDTDITPKSSRGARPRTAEHTPNSRSIPLGELGDEYVTYSSRGRRTRKDIDYRITNTFLDDLVFKEGSSR